jgi:hypothetical protein
MGGPLTIMEMSKDILATAAAAFSQPGANPAPARRFVAHGQVQAQGEQLTVACTSLRGARPFPLTQIQAPKTSVTPSVDFRVELWRACWPQPNVSGSAAAGSQLADPSAFTAASESLQIDIATLFVWLVNAGLDGTLLPSQPTIRTAQDAAFGAPVALGPSGQLAGWGFPLQVKFP